MSLIKTDAIQTLAGKPIVNSTGSVLQVVQGSTATAVSATSSFVSTGLTASITPSSTSSKILVMVQQAGCNPANTYTGPLDIKLQRGTTDIHKFALSLFYVNPNLGSGFRNVINANFLDSPSTASATTYRTVFKANNGGTSYVQTDAANSVSTIILMEIAG